jgi:hypothetical protein
MSTCCIGVISGVFVCRKKHIEVMEYYVSLTFAYGERGLGFAGDDSLMASATAAEVTSAGDSVDAASAFASVLPSAAGGVGLDGGLRSGY